MGYDDMMGLDGLGQIWDPEYMKQALMASAAGAAGIVGTSYLLGMAKDKIEYLSGMEPKNQKFAMSAGALAIAMIGGKLIHDQHATMGVGFTAALGALAIANIVNAVTDGKVPATLGALPEDMELSDYDDDASLLEAYDGMGDLAMLETTGVTAAPGAFSGLGDTTVTPEALQGTVVQQETLGYAPYLA